ncbi:MAG: DUF4835 family protein [Crocinitomicaceae bacterium]|nr:DUF4835 family protein [Crocinitomicaceae bacterium]
MKGIVIIGLIISTLFPAFGQELNCQVTIVVNQKTEITIVEREVLDELEGRIYDFMNNTQWTKDVFTVEERINCNLQIQIEDIPGPSQFSGSMQIQSSRPVFNSSYNTTVFNFQDDDITFVYNRSTPIRYTPNMYNDELSSFLTFYAYLIIGLDYDTFSSRGGTKYLEEAQQIVSTAQISGGPGWRSDKKGKRNRYWLIDNALHELFSPLRDCSYEYHRLGLDVLYEDQEVARKAIYKAMNRLVKVTGTRPNSLNLLSFIQAKSNELKNLYSGAEMKERSDIVNLLKRIDPANSAKYQEILN